jgi:hypothetical protein
MSFSNTLETAILTYIMGTYATWYVGYGTASAGETGSSAAEPSGGTGYAREAYGAYTVTGDTVTNNSAIVFNTATASQGTITHIYFYSALTGGTFLGEKALTTPLSGIVGFALEFPAGDCKITSD